TAVLDPVVTVVMRLLAPPAMTDDRIAQTEGTPAKVQLRTSCPVEARLAMVRRKWDKGDRTALEGSLLLSRILRGYVLRTEPSPFLLNLSYRRIALLAFWLPRIGRLNTQNPSTSANA